VLLKQDKTEAVMAVNGRLEFIEKEMCEHPSPHAKRYVLTFPSKRIEKQIKDIQDKAESVKTQVR
jgi:prefoldin beta subunit